LQIGIEEKVRGGEFKGGGEKKVVGENKEI
jgi:hypothetical protein